MEDFQKIFNETHDILKELNIPHSKVRKIMENFVEVRVTTIAEHVGNNVKVKHE